jgi:uncharacterized protein YjbI with pentapeptide repeats
METKAIGKRISEARKKLSISQAQLAERLFISPQAVGKWERGESLPDMLTCGKLAKVFGVDLNYFSETFSSPAAVETTDANMPKKKKLFGWDMSKGNWIDADFSGLKNLKDKFSKSNLKNCKFVESDLSDLILEGNNIVGCDFSKADLRNSRVSTSEITNTNFSASLLIDTTFLKSELKGCNFSEANFSGTEFESSELTKCAIKNAIWNLASFKYSQLTDITFHGIVDGCSFENCSFNKVIFKDTKITNSFFKCKKLKGIRFIACQADRITYEFLKIGGANVNGILMLP